MRPVTDRFLAAIVGSHQMVSTAVILDAGVEVTDPLNVIGGQVNLDRSAAVRGRCDVTVANPELIPTAATDPLTPFGFELQVRRGIRYPNGDEELVGLGVFGIQRVQITSESTARISGLDRAQRVVEARFTDGFYVPAGETYEAAIRAVIEGQFLDDDSFAGDGVTGLEFSFVTTGFTCPALAFDGQQDRWQEAQKMARDVGCELFFDGDGVCTLRPEPDPVATPPVVTIHDGVDGTLVAGDVDLDREPAFNAVVATGENTQADAVYRAMVVDDDPSSPTFWDGRFGRKPRFYSSPFIASDAQAASAAGAILRGELGIARQVSLTAVPNPALEPSDVVVVDRSAVGVNDELHVLETVDIELTAEGPMAVGTRARQVVQLG